MIDPAIPASWSGPVIIAAGVGAIVLVALLPAPCARSDSIVQVEVARTTTSNRAGPDRRDQCQPPRLATTLSGRRSRLPRHIRVVLRWIERSLAIFGGLVALSWLTIDTSVIVSQSMSPTLQGTNVDTGDRVLRKK